MFNTQKAQMFPANECQQCYSLDNIYTGDKYSFNNPNNYEKFLDTCNSCYNSCKQYVSNLKDPLIKSKLQKDCTEAGVKHGTAQRAYNKVGRLQPEYWPKIPTHEPKRN